MTRIPPPSDDCPKCGEPYPYQETTPRYVPPTPFRGDALAWECQRCGYEVETDTATPEGRTA